MVKKPAKNAPCPCGSGKKYKLCCLPAQQAAAEPSRAKPPPSDDELDVYSNRVVDLIHSGQLDKAEVAARDLMRLFPEVIDGFERLGQIYEARGNPRQAAIHYRQAIALVRRPTDTTTSTLFGSKISLTDSILLPLHDRSHSWARQQNRRSDAAGIVPRASGCPGRVLLRSASRGAAKAPSRNAREN